LNFEVEDSFLKIPGHSILSFEIQHKKPENSLFIALFFPGKRLTKIQFKNNAWVPGLPEALDVGYAR
jgi:hypothetical protein